MMSVKVPIVARIFSRTERDGKSSERRNRQRATKGTKTRETPSILNKREKRRVFQRKPSKRRGSLYTGRSLSEQRERLGNDQQPRFGSLPSSLPFFSLERIEKR